MCQSVNIISIQRTKSKEVAVLEKPFQEFVPRMMRLWFDYKTPEITFFFTSSQGPKTFALKRKTLNSFFVTTRERIKIMCRVVDVFKL